MNQAWLEATLRTVERPVLREWLLWMLIDPTHGVAQHTENGSAQRKAVEDVARLWRNGGTPEQFKAAAHAAYATYAAANANAAAFAADAANAAEAAGYAADAAASAAYAASAAGRRAWVDAACRKLLSLMHPGEDVANVVACAELSS
jgi:hypothetical protein